MFVSGRVLGGQVRSDCIPALSESNDSICRARVIGFEYGRSHPPAVPTRPRVHLQGSRSVLALAAAAWAVRGVVADAQGRSSKMRREDAIGHAVSGASR